ncbi:g9828 [Coccomyxa elongata]
MQQFARMGLKKKEGPFCASQHWDHENNQIQEIGSVAVKRGGNSKVRAIGFDLGQEPIKGVENNAEILLRASNSLLLHQYVLRNKTALAFTKVLNFLQRGSHPDAVLSAYGEFYAELAVSNHASWQDLLLDEILAGRTPLAKAAARGTLSEQGPLHDAAGYDLDVLQRLSLAESTLAGWVNEVHKTPSGWLAAASSVGKAALDLEEEAAAHGSKNERSTGGHITAPLSSNQRQVWRDRIGGSWKWSEALPDLLKYWSEHGYGLVAKHSALQWSGSSGGALTAAAMRYDSTDGVDGVACGALWQELLEHTARFVSGSDASASPHAVLWDASPTQDSSLVWGRLLQEVGPDGLRLVRLPASELSSIDELGRTLSQHPRVRFVVLCDPYQFSASSAAAVISALSGGGSWPANAALYVVVHGGKDDLMGAFNSFSASQGLLGPLWNKFGLQQSWGS